MNRSTLTLSAAALALMLVISTDAALAQAGGAGSAAPAAAAGVSAADGKDFLGIWDIAFQGEQPVTVALTIRDEAGKLAASANMLEANNPVQTISKRENALVLNYQIDFQGMPVAIVLTLTPGTDGIAAVLDAAGGMYVVNGKAIKRP